MLDGNDALEAQGTPASPLYLDIARDLGIEVAVPACDVWTWRRLATRQADPQDEDGSRRKVAARRQGYAKQASYATQRVNEITRLLKHRHGGPCDTDDGWIWFEAVCPFIVEAAEITKRSIYLKALGWAVRHLPRLVEDVGLFRLVMMVNVYAERRSEAENDQADLGLPFVRWLPTNQQLRDTLRPTWHEITTLQIKGWQVIDRPDEATLKARATDLRRQRRHEQGVRPQKSRTREKDLAAMAAEMGISLSTLKRRMRPERADQVDRKVSDRLTATCRSDRFRSPEPTLQPANDEAPPPAPLTDTGYTGRHMRMSASEVQSAIAHHSAINDDLKLHLDAIDTAMSKTPDETKLRVRRNLLRDRNRVALRERRERQKVLAA